MKILTKIAIVALLISLPNFTKAQPSDDKIQRNFSSDERTYAKENPKFSQIDPSSIKIVKLKEEILENYDIQTLSDNRPVKDDPFVLIDKIVNAASKLWKLVTDNAPVVNISSKYATAIPQGIEHFTQLSNWKMPKAYTYAFNAKNLYGAEVINVKYKVIYIYGGDYNGKGKYLTGVSIVPEIVDVAWTYRFDLNAEVPDSTVINIGPSDDPVSALQLQLSWTIASAIKESRGMSVYYIQGDGFMREIASSFKIEETEVKIENIKSAKPLLESNANKVFE